jgi:hypothetical protein
MNVLNTKILKREMLQNLINKHNSGYNSQYKYNLGWPYLWEKKNGTNIFSKIKTIFFLTSI